MNIHGCTVLKKMRTTIPIRANETNVVIFRLKKCATGKGGFFFLVRGWMPFCDAMPTLKSPCPLTLQNPNQNKVLTFESSPTRRPLLRSIFTP